MTALTTIPAEAATALAAYPRSQAVAMKVVASTRTVCGHSQPHHSLPKMVVVKMVRKVRKITAIRMMKKSASHISVPKNKSRSDGISNRKALSPCTRRKGRLMRIKSRTAPENRLSLWNFLPKPPQKAPGFRHGDECGEFL